jgi:copper chaperone CopZ
VTHSSQVVPEALVAKVEELGFDAELISTAGQEGAVLAVGGMTCSACVASVEAALRAVPGVSGADVSLVTGKAQVGGRTQQCVCVWVWVWGVGGEGRSVGGSRRFRRPDLLGLQQ